MQVSGTLYRPTVTRWFDADGRIVKKSDATAVKSKKARSETWRAKYKDREGRQRTASLGTRDRAEAQIRLADLLERERKGAADPFADHRDRPLSEHIEDFVASMDGNDSTADHKRVTRSRIEAVVDGCRFKLIHDLNAGRVSSWLAKRRRGGMGTTTSNHYIGAMRTFSKWLQEDRRHPENLLVSLKKLRKKDRDIRRERRVLSREELQLILAAAQTGKPFRWLNGGDREMCYLLTAYTGLRASEVRSLTRKSLDLDSTPPTVTVAGAYSKNGNRDRLPLHPELCRRLQEWLDDRDELFPGTWHKRAAEMLKADMEAARDAWLESAPDETTRAQWEASDFLRYKVDNAYADFHSLRHRFVTNLQSAGVQPYQAKALARHSSITLTMDAYGDHIDLTEKTIAMNRLGSTAAVDVAPDVALETGKVTSHQECAAAGGVDADPAKTKELGHEIEWEWRDLNPQPMDYESTALTD